MINKRLEDLREVMRREHLAVGTDSDGCKRARHLCDTLCFPPPQGEMEEVIKQNE